MGVGGGGAVSSHSSLRNLESLQLSSRPQRPCRQRCLHAAAEDRRCQARLAAAQGCPSAARRAGQLGPCSPRGVCPPPLPPCLTVLQVPEESVQGASRGGHTGCRGKQEKRAGKAAYTDCDQSLHQPAKRLSSSCILLRCVLLTAAHACPEHTIARQNCVAAAPPAAQYVELMVETRSCRDTGLGPQLMCGLTTCAPRTTLDQSVDQCAHCSVGCSNSLGVDLLLAALMPLKAEGPAILPCSHLLQAGGQGLEVWLGNAHAQRLQRIPGRGADSSQSAPLVG